MRLTTLLASVAMIAVCAPSMVAAQTPPPQEEEVIVDQGVLRPFPIAVVNFSGQNGADLGGVIRANLRRSGYFEPLDPAGFVETGMTLANAPNYPQWTSIGAQAVLYGAVTPRPDGRNDFGFRLYDPYRQCQLVSYQFTATPEQWRRIGHKIADLVYQRMTGERRDCSTAGWSSWPKAVRS
jgi:TolB protein